MDSDADLTEEVRQNLTCHTEGCENEDIAIPVVGPVECAVCGACDADITDILPPTITLFPPQESDDLDPDPTESPA